METPMSLLELPAERLRDGHVFILSESAPHEVRVHRVRRTTDCGVAVSEVLYGSPAFPDIPLETITFPIGYKVKVVR